MQRTRFQNQRGRASRKKNLRWWRQPRQPQLPRPERCLRRNRVRRQAPYRLLCRPHHRQRMQQRRQARLIRPQQRTLNRKVARQPNPRFPTCLWTQHLRRRTLRNPVVSPQAWFSSPKRRDGPFRRTTKVTFSFLREELLRTSRSKSSCGGIFPSSGRCMRQFTGWTSGGRASVGRFAVALWDSKRQSVRGQRYSAQRRKRLLQ